MSVHFGHLYLLAIVCNVAMNISVQVFVLVSHILLCYNCEGHPVHIRFVFLGTHACSYAFRPKKNRNFGLAVPKEMSDGMGGQWVLLDEVSCPNVLLMPLRQGFWWLQTAHICHLRTTAHVWASATHLDLLGMVPALSRSEPVQWSIAKRRSLSALGTSQRPELRLSPDLMYFLPFADLVLEWCGTPSLASK